MLGEAAWLTETPFFSYLKRAEVLASLAASLEQIQSWGSVVTRLFLLAYPARTTRFTSAFIDCGANWAPRPVGIKCPGLELLGKLGFILQIADLLFPPTLLSPKL